MLLGRVGLLSGSYVDRTIPAPAEQRIAVTRGETGGVDMVGQRAHALSVAGAVCGIVAAPLIIASAIVMFVDARNGSLVTPLFVAAALCFPGLVLSRVGLRSRTDAAPGRSTERSVARFNGVLVALYAALLLASVPWYVMVWDQ